MYACHRTHHQRRKRTGAGEIIARRKDDQDYVQDRDKRHSDSYRYNYDYVRMFDSVGIIELDASQNRSLDGVGKATRKKNWGRSRDVDTMKFWCRRTRSRGRLVLLDMATVRLLEATMEEH